MLPTETTFNPVADAQNTFSTMPDMIKIGDTIPNIELVQYKTDGSRELFKTQEMLSGRLVVVFTVPKAFTPVCSNTHLPGFVEEADKLKELGVTKIACLAVNTLDELRAWSQQHDPEGKVTMIPDWGGELVWKMGLGMDASMPRGLGFVAKRSVILLSNSTVQGIYIEEDAAECSISSAKKVVETILGSLSNEMQSKRAKTSEK